MLIIICVVFFDVARTNTDKSLLVVDTDASDNFGLRLDDSKMTDNELEHINLSIPIFDDLLCDFGFYEAFKAFLSIKSTHNKFIVTYDDETMTAESVDLIVGDNIEHYILENTEYTCNKESIDKIFAANENNEVRFSASIANVEYFLTKKIRHIAFYERYIDLCEDKRSHYAYYIGVDNDKAIIKPCVNGNDKVFILSVGDYGQSCFVMIKLAMLLKAFLYLSKRNGAITISFSKNEPKKVIMRSADDDVKVALSTIIKN